MSPPDSAAVQSATHTSVTSAHPGPVTAAAPRVLAIDPGTIESAYALTGSDREPQWRDKIPNRDLRHALRYNALGQAADVVAIEMVASYGMPVGREVFETCVWIGRFVEAVHVRTGREPLLVYRRDVKLHHCHSGKATDATIKQALVDRFASGVRNRGKGTKASPGWFYGFKADVWQAYALAVYVADTQPLPIPVSVSASVESSLPGAGADTDNQTAALSLPRDGAAPAPHPNPMRGCGAGPHQRAAP